MDVIWCWAPRRVLQPIEDGVDALQSLSECLSEMRSFLMDYQTQVLIRQLHFPPSGCQNAHTPLVPRSTSLLKVPRLKMIDFSRQKQQIKVSQSLFLMPFSAPRVLALCRQQHIKAANFHFSASSASLLFLFFICQVFDCSVVVRLRGRKASKTSGSIRWFAIRSKFLFKPKDQQLRRHFQL